MPKKVSRKALIKELDKIAKKIAYVRDRDTCQKCSTVVSGCNRHGSHVIPVSSGHKLRWEPENIKVLCYHCHMNWWHKSPMEAAEWFKAKFPERWEKLQAMRGIKKFLTYELVELRDRLEAELKALLSKAKA